MATTPHYAWTKPDVGGSQGNWGTTLNTLFDAVDAALFAVSTGAGGGLPLVGGTLSGLVRVKTETIARLDLASVGGTTQTLDLTLYQTYTATVNGAVTFALTNIPTGSTTVGLALRLLNPGSAAITWPGQFKWPGGSQPAFTVAGVDVVVAISFDGGTTFDAVLAMKDCR